MTKTSNYTNKEEGKKDSETKETSESFSMIAVNESLQETVGYRIRDFGIDPLPGIIARPIPVRTIPVLSTGGDSKDITKIANISSESGKLLGNNDKSHFSPKPAPAKRSNESSCSPLIDELNKRQKI